MGLFQNLFGKRIKEQDLRGERIDQAVAIFFDHYEDPKKIQLEIDEIAETEEEAKLFFLFIPYIFCRILFNEVEWTDYFLETNEKGEEVEIKFSDSPIYTEMYTTVVTRWDEYVQRDINMILYHSGDLKAINQMLKNGSKLEDLAAMPPKIVAISA